MDCSGWRSGCSVAMHHAIANDSGPQNTAVTVSMHTTKVSAVRYRESEREYSFQSCASTAERLAMSRACSAK